MVTTAEHWIGGRWTGAAGAAVESVSPATGERVGRVAAGGPEECRAAVAAARAAFAAGEWAQSPRLRAEVLFAAAERMEAQTEELARLLSVETGKLLRVARLEMSATISELRYYAGLARAIAGRVIELEPGVYSILTREPAGVAGILVPWNAPGILLVRSLAPALAAGCTAVVKPATQSALFHSALMRFFAQVEQLPTGVLNSFCEAGSAGAEEMVRSPDVDVISFTGSSAVGKKIMAAAAPTLKRLNLELGGKAPAIVLEDCDVDVVACRLAVAGMVLSGQQCTAVNRVLVHASRLSDLRAALTGALSAMRVGRVDAPDTELGPLIDHRNRDRIRSLVAEAEAEGRAVLSGTVPRGDLAGGAFLTPSLLAVDDLESPYVQEEFFGPVMNLESFEDDADAVRRANATRYGLSASVWTNDFARAHRIARALRSGTVWINEHNRLLPEVETGGFRDSGFGRLHGVEGLGEFLATKHIYQPHGQI